MTAAGDVLYIDGVPFRRVTKVWTDEQGRECVEWEPINSGDSDTLHVEISPELAGLYTAALLAGINRSAKFLTTPLDVDIDPGKDEEDAL